MKRRSPQEKKRLSYLKDRRNDYGENDKSSRKNIRRNKRFPHRADRRREQVILQRAKGRVDPEVVETDLVKRRRRSWRKAPDTPLGEVLEYRLARRIRIGIEDPVGGAARIQRIRSRRRRPD